MFKFSVGCTWEPELLNAISKLNEQYLSNGSKVDELYGSLQGIILGLKSARPDFRLPGISFDAFRKFVNKAHNLGIRINYTINAPLCESIQSIREKQQVYKTAIRSLVDVGVDSFTVANSIMFELISETCDIPLEVSSVQHPSSVAQLEHYKKWNCHQVCMDVTRNRDIAFLRAFAEQGRALGISTKLIVNEFCTFGGAPCVGLLQNDCVIHSALGGNQEGLFNNWPFSRCASNRKQNISAWLKSRFILPAWIQAYNDATGITCFKITGRTCRTDWLLRVIDAYMSGAFSGDIRELWVEPGNINPYQIEPLECLKAKYLDDVGFINHWLMNPSFRCDENCGYNCKFCESIADFTFTKRSFS